MQRRKVQGLWRCADVEGPFAKSLTHACRLLYAVACTQSVQVRSPVPPTGTPQAPNILARDPWNLRLPKLLLIFPTP